MIIADLLIAALSLAILMAAAWIAQRRTGQSGWVDTIWSLSVGLVRRQVLALLGAPICAGLPTGW